MGARKVSTSLVMAWFLHIDPAIERSPHIGMQEPSLSPLSGSLVQEASDSFVLGIVPTENDRD